MHTVPLSRRERSKVDKKHRILASAEKLFSQNGYDGTTVQQIADDADVAVGTLFLYVSDKSEILLWLFRDAIDVEMKRAVKRMKTGRKLIPSIHRFLTDLMIPYQKNQNLSKVFWREFLFHKGQVRAELDQQSAVVLQALQEAIVAAQKTGEIDESFDSAVGALHIYSIFHATLAFHLADCLPGTSPGATLEALLASMWQGMAPRGD